MKKIIIGIVVLVILLAGVILFLKYKFEAGTEIAQITPTPTVVLPTISEDIKVDLIPRADRQAVALEIKGLTADLESVEYELTYITGNGLPRGVLGKIKLAQEKEITRDDIVLGTCSSGKCAYDSGVTEVNLSLKFNSSKESKVFQKTYLL